METARLTLRPMTDDDRAPFHALFTDPDVLRYVSPVPIPPDQLDAAFAHYRAGLEANGYGYWALEEKGGDRFAGIILLDDVKITAAFTPAKEIGWLLRPAHWGKGYASEGARLAVEHAFTAMNLDEVVALTAEQNLASRRVMQRLGMTHDPNDDFDHPWTMGTPLQRAVLYRLKRTDYRS